MNDTWEDLTEELKEDLPSEEFKNIDEVLDRIVRWDTEEDFSMNGYDISFSFEKIHALQRNMCINISNDDFELELLFEDGINDGTQLNEYSINPSSSFTSEKREVEILKDIELDEHAIELYELSEGRKVCRTKAQIILDQNKSKIEKLIRNQNYDNYVTGGGTSKTDRYYDKELSNLRSKGVFWKSVYETIEIDANFN